MKINNLIKREIWIRCNSQISRQCHKWHSLFSLCLSSSHARQWILSTRLKYASTSWMTIVVLKATHVISHTGKQNCVGATRRCQSRSNTRWWTYPTITTRHKCANISSRPNSAITVKIAPMRMVQTNWDSHTKNCLKVLRTPRTKIISSSYNHSVLNSPSTTHRMKISNRLS